MRTNGERQRDLRGDLRGGRRASRVTPEAPSSSTLRSSVELVSIDESGSPKVAVVAYDPPSSQERVPYYFEPASRGSQFLVASSLSELPVFTLYHSPGILEVLCGILMLTKRVVLMTAYCFDSPTGSATLSALLRRGVRIQMIMDRKNMKTPSCTKQLAVMRDLMMSAVAEGGSLVVREHTPSTSTKGFSAMHVKSWCLDDSVYIGGSYNFTHNAETSNAEHLVVARCADAAATHRAWFEGVWSRSDPVSLDEVRDRAENRSRSLSRSATRSPTEAPRAAVHHASAGST